jgi:hypothetical protein
MNDIDHEIQQPTPSPVPAKEAQPKAKNRAADRLNIPSSVVRASGFAPGDKVYVVDEDPTGVAPKPCLVLLKQPPPTSLADYGVVKDCRIRVTPAILKKCGLEGDNFQIDGGEGKIVVRPRPSADLPSSTGCP